MERGGLPVEEHTVLAVVAGGAGDVAPTEWFRRLEKPPAHREGPLPPAHHCRGFARGEGRLFGSSGEPKPPLSTFRVLLTGIHLMRAAEVVAHPPAMTGPVPAPAYPGTWSPPTPLRSTGCWARWPARRPPRGWRRT
ncbi:hypothetical protein O7599_32835 [Streptomyces sp. WMMC500]|uniref:hypothetical protein n=1 Tax=Streptomyces sp. WMMC500 TaxID=3015154 RepID=UPI00248AED9F|nr:hypothetical protein [Streptomyces sp. WMMC500]WBB60254.1 hypothetical protein O7599_32835 [Streptomyces sp. WMMC500]